MHPWLHSLMVTKHGNGITITILITLPLGLHRTKQAIYVNNCMPMDSRTVMTKLFTINHYINHFYMFNWGFTMMTYFIITTAYFSWNDDS